MLGGGVAVQTTQIKNYLKNKEYYNFVIIWGKQTYVIYDFRINKITITEEAIKFSRLHYGF